MRINLTQDNLRNLAKTPILRLNSDRRYQFGHNVLHCGDIVELSIDGKNWTETRIECSNGVYYAVVNPCVELHGLFCRFPG